jgi:hypothetical protein
MPSAKTNHPPEHWLRYAEEARNRAGRMRTPSARRELEAIAQAYESLAHHAAKRQQRAKSGMS